MWLSRHVGAQTLRGVDYSVRFYSIPDRPSTRLYRLLGRQWTVNNDAYIAIVYRPQAC